MTASVSTITVVRRIDFNATDAKTPRHRLKTLLKTKARRSSKLCDKTLRCQFESVTTKRGSGDVSSPASAADPFKTLDQLLAFGAVSHSNFFIANLGARFALGSQLRTILALHRVDGKASIVIVNPE
jgi:hypothetical protein